MENYFGVLLKTFPLEQLGPLKEFIKTGKVIGSSQPTQINEPKPKPPTIDGAPTKPKPEINIDDHLDKIVEKISGQYYDLKDTPIAPDEEHIKKSKKQYQTLKFEAGVFDFFRVPSGKETNLISIQDETLLSTESGLGNMIDNILDSIKTDREHLNLFSNIDIVVKLD